MSGGLGAAGATEYPYTDWWLRPYIPRSVSWFLSFSL